MYVPASNAEHRPEVMFDFIDAHPLAALITASPSGMIATHLPMLLDRAHGAHGTLQGHLARANPQQEHAAAGGEVLVIFTGPDAYITPAYYPSKAKHGKVVPTWNYVAVHAYGALRVISDRDAMHRHLEALTSRHEAGRERPWSPSDAPPGYVDQLLGAIVGVEIEITRLEGKWKMSQNRPAEDVDGVIEGLGSSEDPRERDVAALVQARRPDARGRS